MSTLLILLVPYHGLFMSSFIPIDCSVTLRGILLIFWLAVGHTVMSWLITVCIKVYVKLSRHVCVWENLGYQFSDLAPAPMYFPWLFNFLIGSHNTDNTLITHSHSHLHSLFLSVRASELWSVQCEGGCVCLHLFLVLVISGKVWTAVVCCCFPSLCFLFLLLPTINQCMLCVLCRNDTIVQLFKLSNCSVFVWRRCPLSTLKRSFYVCWIGNEMKGVGEELYT